MRAADETSCESLGILLPGGICSVGGMLYGVGGPGGCEKLGTVILSEHASSNCASVPALLTRAGGTLPLM